MRKRAPRPSREIAHRMKVSAARGPWVLSSTKAIRALPLIPSLVCEDIMRRFGSKADPFKTPKPSALTEFCIEHFLAGFKALKESDRVNPARVAACVPTDSELTHAIDSGRMGLWADSKNRAADKRTPDGLRTIEDEEVSQLIPQNARERRNAARVASRSPGAWKAAGDLFRVGVESGREAAWRNGETRAEIDATLKSLGI